MIRRLAVLLSMLSWLGCTTCGSLTCVYDKDAKVWNCGPIQKVKCGKVDCSKAAKLAWPVCTEVPEEDCRAEKPITKCGSGIWDHCYLPRGVENCTELWSYRR